MAYYYKNGKDSYWSTDRMNPAPDGCLDNFLMYLLIFAIIAAIALVALTYLGIYDPNTGNFNW